MSQALGVITPGTATNAYATSAIGGDSVRTTAPLTPSLVIGSCPGTRFCVNGAGTKFACFDSSSNLWFLDTTQTTPAWVEIVTAGSLGTTYNSIAMSLDGTKVYGACANNKIMQILTASPFTVSVLAGSGTAASTDGTGTAAAFNAPYGLDISPDGTYLVTDNDRYGGGNNDWWFRKVVISTAVVTTISPNLGGNQILYQNPANHRVGRSGAIYFIGADAVTLRQYLLATTASTALFSTPGNVVGCFTIDTASPGEVNGYSSSAAYGNALFRLLLSAPSSPSINPLATLAFSTTNTFGQCEAHFRQNVLAGSLFIIDSSRNLWQIQG